jgi:uncharacterized protein
VKIEATRTEIRALIGLAALGNPAAQQSLPGPILERYHSLVGAGRAPAVVAIERGACSGCHVRLPTILENQAACAVALYICPCCRRMLYAPELIFRASPAERPRRRRAGACVDDQS